MSFKSLLSREETIQVVWDITSRLALEQWERIRSRNGSKYGKAKKNNTWVGFPVVQKFNFIGRDLCMQAFIRMQYWDGDLHIPRACHMLRSHIIRINQPGINKMLGKITSIVNLFRSLFSCHYSVGNTG